MDSEPVDTASSETGRNGALDDEIDETPAQDWRDSEEVMSMRSLLESSPRLPIPPRPVQPTFAQLSSLCPPDAVACIQAYINEFEYNYLALPFFTLKRSQSWEYVCQQTENIMDACLPVQCVEAVFIGAYLSRKQNQICRLPLSFKSLYNGKVYRHIVLAVGLFDGALQSVRWGALGISRRKSLMDKPCTFTSLSQLIEDYSQAYKECFHHLLTVYLGNPLPRATAEPTAEEATKPTTTLKPWQKSKSTTLLSSAGGSKPTEKIVWRALKVRVFKQDTHFVASKIDEFERIIINKVMTAGTVS